MLLYWPSDDVIGSRILLFRYIKLNNPILTRTLNCCKLMCYISLRGFILCIVLTIDYSLALIVNI